MTDTLQYKGFLPTEIVTELISKVKGRSTLAKLAGQTPIPFNGTTQFIFNLEGNAQIVGEGEQKLAGKATLTPKIIKPLKFVYQARISEEFMIATKDKQINYLSAFVDGFAKKIATGFDLACLHGVEPRSLTDASFKATNSFDGLITNNIVPFNADKVDETIDKAIQQVLTHSNEVNGLALSHEAAQALSKVKVNGAVQYPEFRFGQVPSTFAGMTIDVNKTLTTTSTTATKLDHIIAGDFENSFKWGYAEQIPLKIIEYGDPDGTGRDLQAYNEICLRTEAFIGWGILDPDAFSLVTADKGGA